MKKLLFVVVAATALFTACKKDKKEVVKSMKMYSENGVMYQGFYINNPSPTVTHESFSRMYSNFNGQASLWDFLSENANKPMKTMGSMWVFLVRVGSPQGGYLACTNVMNILTRRGWKLAPSSYLNGVKDEYAEELINGGQFIITVDSVSHFTDPQDHVTKTTTFLTQFDYSNQQFGTTVYYGNNWGINGSAYFLCYRE